MKKFPKLYKHTASDGTQEWEIMATEGRGGKVGQIVTTFGLAGGKKQELVEVIKVGKNLGKKNETSPYQQACAEAESRWEKMKSRKGYGLTVEESAQIRSVSPMLAQKYGDHYKKVTWDNAFAQPKLDGFRCLAHITQGSKVKLLSRENQPLKALSDLAEVLTEVGANSHIRGVSEYILDGELYAHGMSLNEISSACKKKSKLTENIRFNIYDAVIGTANFETRSLFVRDFIDAAGSDLLVGVETVKVRSESDLMQCQKHFMEEGFEGAMLRYGTQGYEAGKRSSKLLKVKTFEDGEFKVIDYKLARGKYAGCPVFTCETEDGDAFDVLAPGSVDEKKALGLTAKKLIGKMLTVRFQYMTKTDSPVPFLPVAVGFRDLKTHS